MTPWLGGSGVGPCQSWRAASLARKMLASSRSRVPCDARRPMPSASRLFRSSGLYCRVNAIATGGGSWRPSTPASRSTVLVCCPIGPGRSYSLRRSPTSPHVSTGRGPRAPPRRCSASGPCDIAGLPTHAVLRVENEPVAAVVVRHELVNAGRAVAGFGAGVRRQVGHHRNRRILQRQMRRLAFLVVGRGDEHRGRAVERRHAVWLRVSGRAARCCRRRAGARGCRSGKRTCSM